jgi:hypothetical protein
LPDHVGCHRNGTDVIPQNIIRKHRFPGHMRTAVDGDLERAAGIEPASLAWKAKVLPLHNARDIRYLAYIPQPFGTDLARI